MNYNKDSKNCQALLIKLAKKKKYNQYIIDWLRKDVGDENTALHLEQCATQIGITEVNGITKIIKANFCRERICQVCAWRRQAKFVAQMFPVMNYISNAYGYEYIMITLSIKNVFASAVNSAVTDLLEAYKKIARTQRFKHAFEGCIRSVEITYNDEENTFHPHIHILAAVDKTYFSNYITQRELVSMWKKACNLSYTPICHIERVNDNEAGAVEVLKYALKPSSAKEALFVLYSSLRGRRLISFTGVFADIRTKLKLADFDTFLLDDVSKKPRYYNVYNFDVTGGIYTFYESYEIK